jgi:hypothetical protein
MGLFQVKDKTLITYLKKTFNIYVQQDESPYSILRLQPFGLLNNVLAVTSNYTILDDQIYTRYEVDTTTGDVTITLPLITNNNYRPIEIAHVKGKTYKVIISPNVSDANKLTNDALNVIWLSEVGNCIKFVHSPTTGFWESVYENVSSELVFDTLNGVGSTDTQIYKYTNNPTGLGNYITHNHGSYGVHGLELTIVRTGKYSVFLQTCSASSVPTGISLNSNQLTTVFDSITAAHRIAELKQDPGGSVNTSTISYTGGLVKGDVLRHHGLGYTAGTGRYMFNIVYLG